MLKNIESAAQLRQQLDRRGIRYLVVRREAGEYRHRFEPVVALATECGEEEVAVGSLVALRLKDGCPGPRRAETKQPPVPEAAQPAKAAREAEPQAPAESAVQRGVVDDFDPRIRYEGRWLADKQFSQAANGTITYSDRTGAAFQFEFEGRAVTWVFTRAFNRGKARVLLDGREVAVVDLYSPSTAWQQRATFHAAAEGKHVLRVEVLGEKNPASAGTHVDVDQLEVDADERR
jgi:hypothetical protein